MPQVINAGIGGHNSAHLLERIARDVLAHRPTTVVLKVGTNDCLNSVALTSSDAYRANLAELIRVLTKDSRVLVCTVLPFHEPYLLTRHQSAAYRDEPPAVRHVQVLTAIRELAHQHQVPCCDLYSIFCGVGLVGEDPASLLRNPRNSGVEDGVHPTPNGYRVMAAAIAAALRAHSLPLERVVCFGDSITFGSSVAGAGTSDGETYPACLARILAAGT